MNRLAPCLLTGLACACGLLSSAWAQVRIDTPVGGWRATQGAQQDFLQEVNYPASNVNVNGRSAPALIQGHILQKPKTGSKRRPRQEEASSGEVSAVSAASAASADDRDSQASSARQAARLVVDGVALPLLLNENGSFARPWSFGSGAHGVEVRAAGEGAGRRTQFIEAGARTAVKLRVVLSWDSGGNDLDLHVLSPDGQHVFYGARVAANGGALDVDVTTGYGPEIFASPTPPAGTWHVYVNYYGAGAARDAVTVAQLAIITDEGTPRERQQVFRVPMRNPGELTRVRSFQMP
jgi:uncharacterized protein YfaP (DUF2135 family)